MMDFRAISNVRTLPETPVGYVADVDIDFGDGFVAVAYVARPGGGGLSDAIHAAIIAGDFAGPVTPWVAPLAAPPSSLPRAAFWLYLLTLGITRPDVHAAIDAALAAEAITAAYAARLRIKVDDAAIYERLDPDLLDMAQRLGLAADQAALDAHFIAANG